MVDQTPFPFFQNMGKQTKKFQWTTMEWHVYNSLDEDTESDCYIDYFDHVMNELKFVKSKTWIVWKPMENQ